MKKNLLFLRLIFFGLVMLFSSGWVMGQVNISVGETKTENFTIGTSATATLPTGWKADKNTTVRLVGTYASAVSATEQYGGNTLSSTATNGIYNYAAGVYNIATDRAVGGLSSSSASKSVNVYVYLSNNGLISIKDFTISYDVEKYRNGSNPAGFSIQMYYSTNGTAWTSAGADFLTSFAADADNLGYASAPGSTVSITNKTLSQSLTAGNNIYLAWNYSVTSGTTTSNAQALGIDNFSITANIATATWTGGTTDWNTASNWSGNVVPDGNYNVNIPTGNNVIISNTTTANCYNLTLEGTATLTVNTGGSLTSTGTVTVNSGASLATGATYTNSGTANIDGTFQLNSGGWATGNNFVYGAAGTLIFNATYTANSGAYWPASSGPVNVTINTGCPLTLGFARTVTGVYATSAATTSAGNLTTNGSCQINSTAATFDAAITYGAASTLVYNVNATMGRGNEWNNSPANVTLQNNSVINYPNGWGNITRTLTGNLTISSGSALYMDYGSPVIGVGILTVGGNVLLEGSLSLGNQFGGDLKVGGNWTNNSGTFNTNSREVEFNGSSSQSIAGSSATTFAYLKIDNSSGVNLSSSTTVSNTLTLTNGALSIGSNTLTLNGDISSTSGTLTGGSSSNITFGGSGVTTIPAISGGLNNLTVNRTDALTLGSQNQLTVAGTLTNNAGGNFVVQSDASYSGSLIMANYTGTGTFTYKRHMPDANFHMLGSPLSGQTINSGFLIANSIIGMKHYIEGDDDWSTDYASTPPDAAFTLAKGYATKRNASGPVDLTGAPNTALVEITLTKGAGGFGWNLLSNPFTSAIAANIDGGADNLITNNTAVLHDSYEALYIWNGSAYKILNHFGGTPSVTIDPVQNFLQAGQGFFVKSVNPAVATKFQMSTAMQSHQTGVAFKSDKTPWTSIILNAEKNTSKISTQIAYRNGMNRGLDIGYDAGLMKSSPSFALYSRLVEDNGIDFGIQCLPEDYENLVIPIGLDAKAGDIVKFTAQSVNLPEEYNVYLEDRVLGIYTNLSPVDASYNTQLLSDSKGTGRFFVRTSMESALGIGNLDNGNPFKVFTRSNHNQIVIHGEANANTIARIYSISGKQIISYSLKQGTENLVQFNEEAGVYIVKISNEQGTYTQKFGWLK